MDLADDVAPLRAAPTTRRGYFTSANAKHHGSAGGTATVAKHGPQHMQAIARRGGTATVAKYGQRHMSTIGSRGFWRTCERHFGGDPKRFVGVLVRRGLMALDPMPENKAWSGAAEQPWAVERVRDRRDEVFAAA